MSIFRDLLSIKAFREDKAEMVVRKQRSVLAEAVDRRDGAQQQLEKFKAYALSHERSLYDDLCARMVKLREIENVQHEVAGLRANELDHEERVRRAEADRVKEAEQLEADRASHREATRNKEKFVELAQTFADEQLKEFERKEDAEMEEVAETRRERADDEGLEVPTQEAT